MAHILENEINILKIVRNHQVIDSLSKLYLNDSTMADVHFTFASPDADTIQRLPAHRIILAAASPVFHQMFFGDLREENDIIITDASIESFKEFLQFFYLSDIVLTSDNIFDVYQLAYKYDIPTFVDICNEFLIEYLSIETLPLTLQIAIWFDNKQLLTICERMICDHTSELFKSESFLYCSYQVLHKIVTMSGLSCRESSVLDACMRWAESACFMDSTMSPTMANLLEKLDDCFHSIRFIAMTFDEFTECIVKYPGMFKANELEEIFINIGNATHEIAKRSKFVYNENDEIVCSRLLSNQSFLFPIDKVQRVKFKVNETIKLHGIMLGRRTWVPEFPLERIPIAGHIIQIQDVSFSQTFDLNLDKETEIKFNEPVNILKNREYEILIVLNLNKMNFSAIELNEDPIKIGDQILFTFNQDDENFKKNLITELHFTLFTMDNVY